MIPFDPADPFPLIPRNMFQYQEAQAHAVEVDRWLGLKVPETEEKISAQGASHSSQRLWIGLPAQTLLTPYIEIRRILADLKPCPGEKLIDLGAGYGRVGIVAGRHFPELRFIGYEFVPERVTEGRLCLERLGYSNSLLQRVDLLDPGLEIEPAEHYFIYDYGSQPAIEKTLNDLKAIAKNTSITVIGRGRATRDTIERHHPWLSQVISPEHHGNYTFYRSA